MKSSRVLMAVLLAAGVFAASGCTAASKAQLEFVPTVHSKRLPPVKHVWVIVLENKDYAATFGQPSADPYLARTLPARGALLKQYYAIGHYSLDNYLAFVSGQPPNPKTQADCHVFATFAGARMRHGIEQGSGCVYPANVRTIAAQLDAQGLTWKAYEQSMGNDPSREAAACGHPRLNRVDHTQRAEQGDGYATRHDPFVYFKSVLSHPSYCARHVVALGSPSGAMPRSARPHETGLATDLRSAKTTPAFSFITPDLCADGHDYPCVNRHGKQQSALANIDAFLKNWVPRIMHSSAYRQGGLIDITFDESDGPQSDSRACCRERPGPAAPKPGITGPGGGRTGTVLLSPYIKPGTVTTHRYNHYSALASIEKIFGLARLGMARGVPRTFGADVYTARR